MCGIFGGVNVTLDEANNAINAIKRGEDGITVKKINDGIIFAARRHLVKKSGKENSLDDVTGLNTLSDRN